MEKKNLLKEMQWNYEILINGFGKKSVNKVFPNGFISYGIKKHRGESDNDLRKQLINANID